MNYSLDLINLQYNLQYIQVKISEESKQVILANVAFPYNGECKSIAELREKNTRLSTCKIVNRKKDRL